MSVQKHSISKRKNFPKNWIEFVATLEQAKINDTVPLVESYIKLWEEQAVIADKIQEGITDPQSTMELPQLEKLFMDMKKLMFEKQKIMLKINPPKKS